MKISISFSCIWNCIYCTIILLGSCTLHSEYTKNNCDPKARNDLPVARQAKDHKYSMIREEMSPLGTYVIEFQEYNPSHVSTKGDVTDSTDSTKDENAQFIIVLALAKDRTQRQTLTNYNRDAKVQFSPDENHLAVNMFYASNSSCFEIYKRVGTLQYDSLPEQFNDIIDKQFNTRFGNKENDLFDHEYYVFEYWINNDNFAFSVRAYGNDHQIEAKGTFNINNNTILWGGN
jgi:hypothetical protein